MLLKSADPRERKSVTAALRCLKTQRCSLIMHRYGSNERQTSARAPNVIWVVLLQRWQSVCTACTAKSKISMGLYPCDTPLEALAPARECMLEPLDPLVQQAPAVKEAHHKEGPLELFPTALDELPEQVKR
jgi:hypothetical protein